MLKKCFCDTNVLLSAPAEIFALYDKVYICGYVLEEIGKLKKSDDKETKQKAIIADNIIEENDEKVEYIINEILWNLPNCFDKKITDNWIISTFKDLRESNDDIVCLCDDLLFRQKCRKLKLPCNRLKVDKVDKKEFDYQGYKIISLTDEELASHYENPINKWDLLENQYLLIKDVRGEIIDKQKWSNGVFSPISYRKIDNDYSGKIEPLNDLQRLAFDLFQNKKIPIKIVFGKHGSGKDLIMSAHAMDMIHKQIYDKIIFIRNNYIVKDTKEIGFLPGNSDEKLLPFAMPLADHVGGVDELKLLLNKGTVEIQHLGFLRGRDIKNSIVYVSEAENLTKEHIQLIISRIAEGSTLWLNGDFKQQDHKIFEKNNGLKQTINILKGNQRFGCVELSITERSKTAELADLLG